MIVYIDIPELQCITPMIENFINITIKKIKDTEDINLRYIGYNCSKNIFSYFSYLEPSDNVTILNLYKNILQQSFNINFNINDTSLPKCEENIIYDYNYVTVCEFDEDTENISELQVQLLIGVISLMGLYVLYVILCTKTNQLENSENSPY